MTPAQLGHRAAAQGDSKETCPFLEGLDKYRWLDAYEQVVLYRAGGRDPKNHTPINPHLCFRDPRKVCNCCGSCSVECREEGREGVLHTIGGLARKGLVKLMKRLESAATPVTHPEPAQLSSMCRCGHTKYLHATGYCRTGDKGPCGCEHFVPAAVAKCDHTKSAKCVEPGGCAFAHEIRHILASEPDWSKFVPTAKFDGQEFNDTPPIGSVCVAWSTMWLKGGVHQQTGTHQFDVLAGHDGREPGRWRIIRHADGRWADGYGPDGPIAPPAPDKPDFSPVPPRDDSLKEAVRRAREEPDLLHALTWIAVWEADRAVREALRNTAAGTRNPDGSGWSTCFRFSFEQVMKVWAEKADGESAPPVRS